jgi:predicted glycoside hydrolase/deacetylase ChbG (UPF0249 family)
LIVNGDDLGRSDSNTRGIIEGYRTGILTSTSIVAAGTVFDLGVSLATANPGLGVGVHLVLHEYPPCADPATIPTLVRPDGSFFTMGACFRRLTLGQFDERDVRREWEAQVRKVLEAGIRPTHLDGHCHIHAHPRLAKVLVDVAATFGVPAARLPSESLLGGSCRSAQRYLETMLINSACWRSKATWGGRLRHPEYFFGFKQGGHISPRVFESVAASLRPGVSELMVHPGLTNDDRPYNNGYDWQGDLATMRSYSKEECQRRFGVQLVSYRDAWN